MLERRPTWSGTWFWTTLFLIGCGIEAVLYLVAQFWARRYSPDSLALRPILFLLSLSCVYLSAQLLRALFAVELVAGMSLSLLSTMLAWLAAALLAIVGALFIGMALAALVLVPVRLGRDGWKFGRNLFNRRPLGMPEPKRT